MNNASIVTQLEKALKSKDDKELRLRIEVLLDIMKETSTTFVPQTPQIIQPTYFDTNSPKIAQPTVSTKQPKITGPGAISSANSEQINYTRPKGT